MTTRQIKTYGFFHPYCNAGGGGERVLWQAVENTLKLPHIRVAVYTGDTDSDDAIFANVFKRFNIDLDKQRVDFIRLKYRWLVDPKTWPFLTLLGQAIGSMVLAMEAMLQLRADVWLDTMGYPFSYPLVWLWLGAPIVAYVHFPVISDDMLGKLQPSVTSVSGIKQLVKFIYWSLFMNVYRLVGLFVDVVLTNSSWTQNHIRDIWILNNNVSILYPPCSTEKFITEKDLTETTWTRDNTIVSLSQFRPEKRHDLIIEQYAEFLKTATLKSAPKLILIGSIRDAADEEYVAFLKQKATKLNIPETHIEFILDAKYQDMLAHLRRASFGLNAMWNEHFGIAVVEYVASGLIPLVHASAGPLLDIVVPWNSDLKKETSEWSIETRTGFFFKDVSDPDYKEGDNSKFPSLAEVFVQASNLTDEEKVSITKRGKECVLAKFSDEKFDTSFIKVVKSVDTLKAKDKRLGILAGAMAIVGIFLKVGKTLV